jgi:hypothetical protein
VPIRVACVSYRENENENENENGREVFRRGQGGRSKEEGEMVIGHTRGPVMGWMATAGMAATQRKARQLGRGTRRGGGVRRVLVQKRIESPRATFDLKGEA